MLRKIPRLLVILLCAVALFGAGRKTVHVRSYTRKNGTVVRAHTRSAPGRAGRSSRTPRKRYSSPARTHRPRSVAPTSPVTRDPNGRITRSAAAKDAFERDNPCPSSGQLRGPCPGYIVDHVKPLACGGADEPTNMQWQTTEAAKAKDKTERMGCAVR